MLKHQARTPQQTQAYIAGYPSRQALLGIKRMLENNMDHQFIAEQQEVSLELVEDIACGRQFTWLFRA